MHSHKPRVIRRTKFVMEILDIVLPVLRKDDVDFMSILRYMETSIVSIGQQIHLNSCENPTYRPQLCVICLGSGSVLIQATI